MKKILLLFIILGTTNYIFAQRYENSLNINASGGIRSGGAAFYLGVEKLLSERTSVSGQISFSPVKRSVNQTDIKAKLAEYSIEAAFNYYIFSVNDFFFPYISVGGNLGYARINNNDDFPSTLKLEYSSQFLYKIKGSLGFEFNFNKISLFLSTNPYYDFRNEEAVHVQLIGLKYYF